nr:helix-turn-helix transcriptional regulator [Candidatus Freyarchaeota archaeon]
MVGALVTFDNATGVFNCSRCEFSTSAQNIMRSHVLEHVLPGRVHQVLDILKVKKFCTVGYLAEKTGLEFRKVENIITNLKRRGMVEVSEMHRAHYYSLKKEVVGDDKECLKTTKLK